VYLLLERVVSRSLSDKSVFCRLQPIGTCPLHASWSRVPVMTPVNAGHIAVERSSPGSGWSEGDRLDVAATHVDVDRKTRR